MFYGHSRRHGLVVPNPDPQFGNQSEHRIARTRPAADRPSQRLWAHRGFKPNAAARSSSRGVTNPWNSPTINWRKFMTARTLLVLIAPLLVTSGCGATIHGTVLLVDSRQQPIANESPKGAVVNMINTTAAVEQASSSATVDEKGEFESSRGRHLLRQEGPVQAAEDPGGQAEVDQGLGHRRRQDHQSRRGQYPAARDVSGRYPPRSLNQTP